MFLLDEPSMPSKPGEELTSSTFGPGFRAQQINASKAEAEDLGGAQGGFAFVLGDAHGFG